MTLLAPGRLEMRKRVLSVQVNRRRCRGRWAQNHEWGIHALHQFGHDATERQASQPATPVRR